MDIEQVSTSDILNNNLPPEVADLADRARAKSDALDPAEDRERTAGAEVADAEDAMAKAAAVHAQVKAEADQLRCDLGEILREAHRLLGVKQGERSGRWAAFLMRAGVNARTAARYVERTREASATSDTVSEVLDPQASTPNGPKQASGKARSSRIGKQTPRGFDLHGLVELIAETVRSYYAAAESRDPVDDNDVSVASLLAETEPSLSSFKREDRKAVAAVHQQVVDMLLGTEAAVE